MSSDRRGLLIAFGVHALGVALAFVVLGIAAHHAGQPLDGRLSSSDGGFYELIAAHGYPGHLDTSSVTDPAATATARLAFPPAYPALVALVRLISPLGLTASGVLVSILAGFASAWAMFALALRLTGSQRSAILATAVWSALPLSIVYGMVYSEALFTALALWAVVAAMDERWLTAGALGFAAGLTRSTGLAVAVAVVVAAVLAVRRPASTRAPTPRIAAGAVLAVIGTPLWWVTVAILTGRPAGWFDAQRTFWQSHFDFGAQWLRVSGRLFAFDPGAESLHGVSPADVPLLPGVYIVVFGACMAGLLVTARLVVDSIGDRRWVVPTTFAVAAIGLALMGAGYYVCKLRFLLPVAPLVVPAAVALTRLRTWHAAAWVGLLALLGAWWGAFMLTDWTAAI